MTTAAIIAAAIAGSLGAYLQIVATSILVCALGWIALSLVIGGPWIALIWLCKQVTRLTRGRR